MTLETIMTRHVIMVSMDDSLRHVRDLLAEHHFHHVVVNEGGRVVGIISDRDVLSNLSPFVGKVAERTVDAASLNRRVHQIMTRSLIAGKPGTPIGEAAVMLLSNNISCLPIIDAAGACAGIVTWRDVLRWAFREEAERAGLVGTMKAAA